MLMGKPGRREIRTFASDILSLALRSIRPILVAQQRIQILLVRSLFGAKPVLERRQLWEVEALGRRGGVDASTALVDCSERVERRASRWRAVEVRSCRRMRHGKRHRSRTKEQVDVFMLILLREWVLEWICVCESRIRRRRWRETRGGHGRARKVGEVGWSVKRWGKTSRFWPGRELDIGRGLPRVGGNNVRVV